MVITSYIYSIPYVLFLLFLALLMLAEFRQKEKKQDIKYLRYVVIACFSLFFGLKGFVGRDVFNYYNLFDRLPTIWDWDTDAFFSTRFEMGFNLYMVIIKSICPNFFFFSFINVLIDALILDVIIRRYSKYYVLAFIIYIGYYGFIFEAEQIRNAKAVMLFVLSLKYISEKKMFMYLIINMFGVLFHYSAILYIILYPFLHKRYPLPFYLIIYITGLIVYFLQIKYLGPIILNISRLFGEKINNMATSYLNSNVYGTRREGFSLGFIERTVVYFFFCLFFSKKLIDSNSDNIIIINIYVLYFISFYYFAEVSVVSTRVSALFIIANTFLYPNILKIIKIDKYMLLFILIGFSCYKIAGFTQHKEYTYENCLISSSNYNERVRIRNIAMDEYYRIANWNVKTKKD